MLTYATNKRLAGSGSLVGKTVHVNGLGSSVWDDGGRLSRRDLAYDVLTAVGFGLLAIAAQSAFNDQSASAAVLLTVALVVRRYAWWLMVGLAFAAALIQVVTGEVASLTNGSYFVLFFTLGSHRDGRVRRLGLVSALIAILVAAGLYVIALSAESVAGFLAVGMFAALTAVFTLGGWVAGLVRWQQRQAISVRIDAEFAAVERRRLRELYDQEQERSRIAADMHDVIAHSLAVVAAQTDGARYSLYASPGQAEHALVVIGETARSAMTDVRRLLAQLRDREEKPSATLDFERRSELIPRMTASGMKVRATEIGKPPKNGLISVTAHRLLSESLTNALKHGSLGEPVVVEEDWTDGYRLRVTNALSHPLLPQSDTTGDSSGMRGHGIVGMTERAAVARGTVTSRRHGDTWVVDAHIPDPSA